MRSFFAIPFLSAMWKKKICIGMGIGVLLAGAFFFDWKTALFVSKQTGGKTVIVIDSGHGGVDPGKVGVSGSLEKDINLSIAKKVKTILEKKNYFIVMTREADKGLYEEQDKNKKIADLKARVALIEETNPKMVVSIHQNSYGSAGVKGAQVFYYSGSEEGKRIGDLMQETIKTAINDGNHRMAKGNSSYYMLCKTKVPLIIVECGFLSNPEEEKLLKDEKYQQKMAEAIATGIEKCITESAPKT